MKLSALTVLTILIQFSGYAQEKSALIIKDYGIINNVDNVVKPDPTKKYKIVIDLKTSVEDPAKLNRGLENVARMLNLHAAGGVPAENLEVAVAVHGGATPIILDEKGYGRKYGVSNPNLDLLADLKEAGVELYICSQSLIGRKYEMEEVDQNVQIALSMLTIVSEKMVDGYHLMVFQ